MKNFNFRMLLVLIGVLITSLTTQVWADTYKLTYKKDMGSGDYNTGTTYHEMTQCPDNSNIYYFYADLEAGDYGFFLQKNSQNYFKANAPETGDYDRVTLYDYGDSNYGNSSHRVTYSAASAGTYVFTYEADNKIVYVSPAFSQSVKLYHGQSTDHDSWHDLPNNETLTEIGTSEEYYVDLDLTGGTKKYVYVRAGANSKYFRGTSTLTVDNSITVYYYANGDNNDKVNFTPSVSDTYRFTWNHIKKTIKVNRVFNVSFNGNGSKSGSMSDQTILSGTATALSTNAFSKTGYEFDGWNTAVDGSGTPYADEEEVTLDASTGTDLTLYAQWKQVLTLDDNGGTSDGHVTVYYKRSSVSNFLEAVKAGYTCNGYYTATSGGNKIFAASTGALSSYSASIDSYVDTDGKWIYDGTPSLSAQWTANNYTIAFDANDAQYVGTATGSTGSIAATYDSNVTLTTNGFARAGYTFAGWATSPTGAVVYTDGQTTTTPPNLTSTAGGTGTLYAKWTPLTYTVTLNATQNGGYCATTSTTVTMGATYGEGTGLSGSLPNATPPSGYRFLGWYTLADGGTKVENSTQVTTASDHTLYAHYIEITYVYFYNNLGWNEVYVTYDAYWDHDRDGGTANSNGAGNYGKIYHQMTPVEEGSKVYRDEIPASVLASWKYNICFNSQGLGTRGESSNYNNFDKGQAVFRRDFDSFATMFVPYPNKTDESNKITDKNGGSCIYYSTNQWVDKSGDDVIDYRYEHGYWTKYNGDHKYGEAGYVLKGKWDNEVCDFYFRKSNNTTNTYTITKYLPAGTSFKFRMYKHCKTSNTYSSWFIHNKDQAITSVNAFDLGMSTNIAKSNTTYYDQINTTIAGDYKFTLNCDTATGQLKLSVQYPDPVADGDWFRVVYTWVDKSSVSHTRVCQTFTRMANNGSEWFEAHVHKDADVNSRSLKLQHYETVSGTPQWKDVHNYDLSGVTSTGVYTFNFLRSSSGTTADQYELFGKYDGAYYLRSDVTGPGWDHYKMMQYGDVKMTPSDFSKHQTTDPYTHYYCQYVKDSSNVACTVATSNSPSICDTLLTDAIIGAAEVAGLYKHLPKDNPANIRFMYNDSLNTIKRAYLKSATGDGNKRYLVLHGDNHVFNSNGTAIAKEGDGADDLKANELLFEDKGNWIYELSLKASPIAKAKVMAKYNGSDRYLVGGESTWKTILGAEADDLEHKYDLAGTYDFKTNRLMLAWTPDGTDITANLSDVDMLWVRHADDPATQITFNGGSLTDINVVGAIRFDWDDLIGKVGSWGPTTRKYLKYFISFPFDVNVSDVFGLNKAVYGREYVIQKYNGAKRAKDGLYLADGVSFWEDLTIDSVMHANEGYCVIMDNDYLNSSAFSIWENKSSGSSIYLYFPATSTVDITGENDKTTTVAPHESKRNVPYKVDEVDYNMQVTDSHWNLVGGPYFSNAVVNSSEQEGGSALSAYYRWHYDNTWKPWVLSGEKGTTYAGSSNIFNAMSCFMVQWHGTITWRPTATNGPATPASVAARRTNEQPKNHMVHLQLLRDEEEVDRAFVELKEGAHTDFELCEDMNKIINSNKPNLYVLSGIYAAAYSQVPVENQIVPVGVIVRQNGTYTFSMPSNFDGSVTLVDSVLNTRTNLAISDYEAYMERGTIKDRFYLEINIKNVPTAIDGITDGKGTLKDGKAHKFIQNGVMYILRDGNIYDARGTRVK